MGSEMCIRDRGPGAGKGLPVDRADVVAWEVRPKFVEFDSAAAEHRVVLAEEEVLSLIHI